MPVLEPRHLLDTLPKIETALLPGRLVAGAIGFMESRNMMTKNIKLDELAHTQKYRYVYAFAGEEEIAQFIRKNGSDFDRHQLKETLKSWDALRPRIMSLLTNEASIADEIKINDIPQQYHDSIQKIVDKKWFQQSYVDQSVRFGMVEIDKLVAPQRSVNTEYCEQLKSSWPSDMGLAELLEICFGTRKDETIVHHLEIEKNSHVFSSSNTDVRLLSSYVKTITSDNLEVECGGIPLQAIISIIGTGTPLIHAFEVEKRIILNNGFHRVYALRSMGFKEIPVLISKVDNARLEIPNNLLGLPRDYLIHEPRPVLMKDFFEPDFSVLINVQKRQRIIQINTAGNVFDVPL